MMTFQEVVAAIETLSIEDHDRLYELIHHQKIADREAEVGLIAITLLLVVLVLKQSRSKLRTDAVS